MGRGRAADAETSEGRAEVQKETPGPLEKRSTGGVAALPRTVYRRKIRDKVAARKEVLGNKMLRYWGRYFRVTSPRDLGLETWA